MIAEYHVITNNFSAEYGRNMGSVINYVTKSGTNGFHGTGFEYYTGSFTDALRNQDKSPVFGICQPGQAPGTVTLFTNATDGCRAVHRPRFNDNRFGGTFGGPLLKNRSWFFVSYQEDQQRAGTISASSTATPTAEGLRLLENTYCGLSVSSYTPNPCPSHPALGAYLMNSPYAVTIGSPHSGGGASTVTVSDVGGANPVTIPLAKVSRTVPDNAFDRQGSGRFDWQVTNKDRFFARYILEDFNNDFGAGTGSSGVWVAVPGRAQQIGLDWARTVTNTFVNQARFSYSRAYFAFQGGSHPDCTVANITNCPTNIQISGNLTIGTATNLPQDRLVNNTQWQDNASWVRGRHTMKFGGEYARQRSPNNFCPTSMAISCSPITATWCETLPADSIWLTDRSALTLRSRTQGLICRMIGGSRTT